MSCIHENSTLGETLELLNDGLPLCEGVHNAGFLALHLLFMHEGALLLSAAAFLFARFVFSFLTSIVPVKLGRWTSIASRVCAVTAYILAFATVCLHISATGSPQRIALLVFGGILALFFVVQMALHISLSIRSHSWKGLLPWANTVIVPVGKQKQHAALAVHFVNTPQLLTLAAKQIETGKQHWTVAGAAVTVDSRSFYPGSLRVVSLFSETILPFRVKSVTRTGLSACLYSKLSFQNSEKILGSAAKSMSQRDAESAEPDDPFLDDE